MRVRFLVAVVSTGLLGGASAILACDSAGGATDEAPGSAVEGGARETSALDVSEAEPRCDPTEDLLGKVRDAAIGDGASTTGICLGCARTECGDAILKCTQDCPCQSIVGGALECFLTKQQIGCAAALADPFVPKDTRKYALELMGCVQNQCPTECAVDAAAAPDASSPGDAGGDA